MKKLLAVLLIITSVILVGCAPKFEDPFKSYHGKTSQQIFDQGEAQLAKGDYDQATKSFEALDALYPFGPYAQQGQLDIIYAYYKNNDFAEASIAADRYIRLYPRGRDVDYAYYMKGRVLFEQGNPWLERRLGVDAAPRDLGAKRDAFAAFNQLVLFYPHSRYVPDSILHMRYLRNLFARHQILIAQFYYRRRAYVASANRAAYVLQHFQRTPQVIAALKIMIDSYQKLGLVKLANNTKSILQASYPKFYDYHYLYKS